MPEFDLPSLSELPELAPTVRGVFEYAQFLLDDPENLTPTGGLVKDARKQLAARTLELLEGGAKGVDVDSVDLDGDFEL